jgi:hypothetical protein
MHGGIDWIVIIAFVPVRTKMKCHSRWHNVLDLSIDEATTPWVTRTEDEDSELKDSMSRVERKTFS